MHLDQLGTVKLVEVEQRIEVDVQHATVRGRAETSEREEVDRHAEVLTDHDRNVLGELQDRFLSRKAVRDHMAAVLGGETGRAATSGNVMRVRGPALYPAPAALAADQTMSSSSSRTLGTRARFGWPRRVVVEPSASSLAGPLVARLLVSQSPRFFSRHAHPCGSRCGERGSQGVQAIHPVRSPSYDGEGLFDDGGDVVVPPERGVQHGLVADNKRERRAVGTQAVQVFRAAVAAERTTDGLGGKADDAAEVRGEV